ncbi:MAG: hypothetical protein FWC16_04230 [Defluviitaleaceae bacterium]|nr:hypothetical protein [Defluviitaleaceae bacterium]MCL2274114.1 hypothetical protein [Defluviitaleaceae bacterium]
MKQVTTTKQPTQMIKHLLSLTLAVVLLFCLQTTVFAASQGTVLTVNPVLNVSDAEDEDYPSAESIIPIIAEPVWAWHPISVVNEPMNGFNAVRRTYALPPDVNPAVISTAGFEMFGQQFTFAYVLQQPTSNESFIEMRQSVTIETRTRNLDDILPNLEQDIWFERDGFAGTLVLDIHSITSEVAGTSRHTSTATRQRTFPHLSSPDNSLIPRTITDGGTTFHLSSVDWQSSSISSVDGHPVASSHTAHATFTAQVTQTRTTGYTVTAEYVGTVFRTTQGKTLFTAIFYGEPIIEIWLEETEPELVIEIHTESEYEPVQMHEQSSSDGTGNGLTTALAVIGTLLAIGALGVGGFFLARHFLGYNVTVYSIDGPREIVKAGKIKLDVTSPEPTIVLDDAVVKTPRKQTDISSRLHSGQYRNSSIKSCGWYCMTKRHSMKCRKRQRVCLFMSLRSTFPTTTNRVRQPILRKRAGILLGVMSLILN